jgi:hypothetical protein
VWHAYTRVARETLHDNDHTRDGATATITGASNTAPRRPLSAALDGYHHTQRLLLLLLRLLLRLRLLRLLRLRLGLVVVVDMFLHGHSG